MGAKFPCRWAIPGISRDGTQCLQFSGCAIRSIGCAYRPETLVGARWRFRGSRHRAPRRRLASTCLQATWGVDGLAAAPPASWYMKKMDTNRGGRVRQAKGRARVRCRIDRVTVALCRTIAAPFRSASCRSRRAQLDAIKHVGVSSRDLASGSLVAVPFPPGRHKVGEWRRRGRGIKGQRSRLARKRLGHHVTAHLHQHLTLMRRLHRNWHTRRGARNAGPQEGCPRAANGANRYKFSMCTRPAACEAVIQSIPAGHALPPTPPPAPAVLGDGCAGSGGVGLVSMSCAGARRGELLGGRACGAAETQATSRPGAVLGPALSSACSPSSTSGTSYGPDSSRRGRRGGGGCASRSSCRGAGAGSAAGAVGGGVVPSCPAFAMREEAAR